MILPLLIPIPNAMPLNFNRSSAITNHYTCILNQLIILPRFNLVTNTIYYDHWKSIFRLKFLSGYMISGSVISWTVVTAVTTVAVFVLFYQISWQVKTPVTLQQLLYCLVQTMPTLKDLVPYIYLWKNTGKTWRK